VTVFAVIGRKNFNWVVRPPIGFEINSEFKPEEQLPLGFKEKIVETKKGIIVPIQSSNLKLRFCYMGEFKLF
jgi:hypothetical protein